MSRGNVWGNNMSILKKKKVDTYLNQPLETDRFRLGICGKKRAFELSLCWKDDPDILMNMMIPVQNYSQVGWYNAFAMPDPNTLFYHAIIDKDSGTIIGMHKCSLNHNGTVSVAIVVHEKGWWGKDVYFETRSKILHHFAKSDRVVRFEGRCLDRNFPSIFNYKKLGFRLIGYDRKSILDQRSGAYSGTCRFEMLADEIMEAGT